jgi:hypothetical protein
MSKAMMIVIGLFQGDCTEDAMHVAVSHCHGKTSCEIPVGISIVAHGLATILGVNKKCGAWHDRHDYMEVSKVPGMTGMTTWKEVKVWHDGHDYMEVSSGPGMTGR